MNKTKHQVWPDGTLVKFTDEARDAMQPRPGTRPLPTPAQGPLAVYTIDNVDSTLHDVVLRETGETWSVTWLRALPTADQKPEVAAAIKEKSVDRAADRIARARRELEDARAKFNRRCLDAICTLGDQGLSVRQIANATGMSKSQIHRLQQTEIPE